MGRDGRVDEVGTDLVLSTDGLGWWTLPIYLLSSVHTGIFGSVGRRDGDSKMRTKPCRRDGPAYAGLGLRFPSPQRGADAFFLFSSNFDN